MKVIKMNQRIKEIDFQKQAKSGSYFWMITMDNGDQADFYSNNLTLPFKVGSIISYELIDKGYWYPVLKLHEPKLKTII